MAKLTLEQAQQIQALRQLFREPTPPKKETLKNAIEEADEFTERTGLKAYVIRRKGKKYYTVYEGFFDTYKYKGKIYYQTEPNLDSYGVDYKI